MLIYGRSRASRRSTGSQRNAPGAHRRRRTDASGLPAQTDLGKQAHGVKGAGHSARQQRLAEARPRYQAMTRDAIRDGFAAQLRHVRAREIVAGACLVGPHRDDMAFTVDGHDLRAFGSRGQQRTAAWRSSWPSSR